MSYDNDSLLPVTSCILWDNTDDCSGDCDPPGCACPEAVETAQIHSRVTPSTAVFGHNCIQGFNSAPGNGNISDDPRFLDPQGLDADSLNDFFLGDGSPCIDAADSDPLPPAVFLDLTGVNLRAIDDAGAGDTGTCTGQGCARYVDMGVYESVGLPYILAGQPGESFVRSAFTGFIDSLSESTDGVNIDLGIDRFVLVFSEEVFKNAQGSASIDEDDFELDFTGGAPCRLSLVSMTWWVRERWA